MPYPPDLPSAARRHLEAADRLAEFDGELPKGPRRDVAGYLYGIAAECALKAMMIDVPLRPLAPSRRREDPFYAHFPALRTMLRDTLHGRTSLPLLKLISSDAFLMEWDTDMRYARASAIPDRLVVAWRSAARDAVGAMDT